MTDRRTPAGGWPSPVHLAVAELREDLRQHAANDEHELREIRSTLTEVQIETGQQSAMLGHQTASLSRLESAGLRREALDDRRMKAAISEDSKVRIIWWSAAAAILTALGVELVHRI